MTPIEHVRDDRTSGGKKVPVWRFRCECGGEKIARLYAVRSGKTKSCGCARGKARLRHGASAGGKLAPEYRAWRCMLTRAKNPNIAHAGRYSLRGIGVAPEWDSGGDGLGYHRFLAHVGPKPGDGYSLDRVDNDRGYEPGNVRWATHFEQGLNTSKNRLLEFYGEVHPLTEWARRLGLRPGLIRDRLDKLGWTIDRAFFEPPPRRRPGGV